MAAQEKRPAKLAASARSDEWMRIELDVYRLAKSPHHDPYSGKFFLGFDQHTYWKLDDRSPYAWPAQPTQHRKGDVYAQKTGQRMHAIAYIDRSGKVTGFAWDNHHHGTPVTWSCYTSAIGMRHNA